LRHIAEIFKHEEVSIVPRERWSKIVDREKNGGGQCEKGRKIRPSPKTGKCCVNGKLRENSKGGFRMQQEGWSEWSESIIGGKGRYDSGGHGTYGNPGRASDFAITKTHPEEAAKKGGKKESSDWKWVSTQHISGGKKD